jgi:hypothetical protein
MAYRSPLEIRVGLVANPDTPPFSNRHHPVSCIAPEPEIGNAHDLRDPCPEIDMSLARSGKSRIGWWYATGVADKVFRPGDPDFNVHGVVGNSGGLRFPLERSLLNKITLPLVSN